MQTKPQERIDNLPADVTTLVGRREEAAAVKSLLGESRLVTLTGIGGVGKTRLAVQVARQTRRAFADGVCFVSLADLTQPELLNLTVVSELTRAEGSPSGVGNLVAHLSGRSLLLVLDNCEHLVEACAALADEILRGCEDVRILATSRERLRVEGEVAYSVPPLAVPDATERLSPRQAGEYDAVSLFIQRAVAVNPTLELGPEDTQAIVTLCQRLDGLPLAIELVARRAGSLPIGSLARAEADHFRLLTGGSRTAPARHQTLRAAVDHSYDLCTDPARRLWARMSVFAGGADMESIQEVCGGRILSADELDQGLSELIDKSIVSFDGRRYRMLETIREYGRGRLRELGEETEVRRAHRDHFADLMTRMASPEGGASHLTFLEGALAEQANLRSALEFGLTEPGEASAGLTMACGLWTFWLGCGLQREGRHWLDTLQRAAPASAPGRVAALWINAHLAVLDGAASDALALASECEALATRVGETDSIAHAAFVSGSAQLILDDVDQAISRLEEAVRLEAKVSKPNPLLVSSMLALGVGLSYQGQLAEASAVLEAAREECLASGDELQLSWCLLFLGLIALLAGRLVEAEQLTQEVLIRNRRISDRLGMSSALEFLGWVSLAQGDPTRSTVLMGASEAMAAPLGSHLGNFQGLRRWHVERTQEAEAQLGKSAFAAAYRRGCGMDMSTAVNFALDQAGQPKSGPTQGRHAALTPREHEVARLVASGQSNKEIAATLVISQRTAEAHVENLLRKLGFNSRTQIAAMFAGDPDQ